MDIEKLGNILSLHRGYDLTSKEMVEGPVPVAGSNGIIGFHNKSLTDSPAITVGRSGSVGKVHYYNESIWPHNTALYVDDFKGNSPKYLYYILSLLDLGGLCDNSVIPSLNRNFVYPLKVPFIKGKSKQDKIISILNKTDTLIEINRKINNELESLAKLIYDYWFVQFDFPNEEGKPYKSSGGKMVWNETLKREIPEGWEVTKTGIFATIERGTVITEKECTPGKIKVVAAGMDFAYYHNQSNRDENIITISTSGANAGFINFWREPIYASDCMTLQCKNLLDTLLCLQNLRNYQPFVFNMAHGSAQPHVYPEQVYDIPIIKYPQNLKSKIEKLFVDINNKIASNIESNKILQSLRDFLLPLLMNGQVTIKD